MTQSKRYGPGSPITHGGKHSHVADAAHPLRTTANLVMLQMSAPFWLLLLPLPPFWWWAQRIWRRRSPRPAHGAALYHPLAQELITLQQATATKNRQLPWLWFLGCAAFIIALARPQWLLLDAPDNRRGHDIMLALDLSGSMRAEDFTLDGKPVNRLAMLKKIVSEFLKNRDGDRFGVLVFGDDVYPLTPLTADRQLLQQTINELENGMAGEKTALGMALSAATQRLQASQNQRVLILFTDGSNTAGTIGPDAALQQAKLANVQIFTVGIGSEQEVPFPRAVSQAPALTVMPLDDALLQRMATETNGAYFHASNLDVVKKLGAALDAIPVITQQNATQTPRLEWYWLPLLLGLTCFYFQQQRRPVAP